MRRKRRALLCRFRWGGSSSVCSLGGWVDADERFDDADRAGWDAGAGVVVDLATVRRVRGRRVAADGSERGAVRDPPVEPLDVVGQAVAVPVVEDEVTRAWLCRDREAG